VAVSASAHTSSSSKEFIDRGITLDAASADPSPKVSTVKDTLMVSKLSHTEIRQPLATLR
jgi:hypothetical protein